MKAEMPVPDDLFEGAFEAAPMGMALLNDSGRIIAVNRQWREFSSENGGRENGYLGHDYLATISLDAEPELAAIHRELGELLAGRRTRMEKEYPCHSPDRKRWFLMYAARFTHVHGAAILVMHIDITDRRLAEEQAREAADRDALTGLLNRRSFFERAGQALEMARRNEESLGLLYVDLDNFKEINDSEGHALGDQVLTAFGLRLTRLVRDSDAPARIGGDEFVVICPGADGEKLREVALRIQQGMQRRLRIKGRRIQVACSIGISRYPEDGDTIEALLQAGDMAMYRAKAGPGPDRIAIS